MDPQHKAELKSKLRIVLMQLGQHPEDPELEKRAQELYNQIRELDH